MKYTKDDQYYQQIMQKILLFPDYRSVMLTVIYDKYSPIIAYTEEYCPYRKSNTFNLLKEAGRVPSLRGQGPCWDPSASRFQPRGTHRHQGLPPTASVPHSKRGCTVLCKLTLPVKRTERLSRVPPMKMPRTLTVLARPEGRAN